MSTETEKQVQNGVNVDALLGARDALSKAPEAAKFNWKASCKWMNGTHSQTSIQGFYGLGSQQSHKTEFTFDTDHPEIFASEDNGATPVEYVLHALAGCLTAGLANIAAARGQCRHGHPPNGQEPRGKDQKFFGVHRFSSLPVLSPILS